MPEHHLIADIFAIPGEFLVFPNLKDAHDLDVILIMGAGVSIFDIFPDPPLRILRL